MLRRTLVTVLLLTAWSAGPGPAGAEIVDRVLAVVDGVIITQSDVTAAIRLGLQRPPQGTQAMTDVRDALVERQLILAEVDRYAPPDPPEADIERDVEAVRAALGAAPFEAVLRETGGTVEQLRRYVRDTRRIESYMQQRFGTIQPSDAEVAEYYRTHAAEFGQRSLAEVREAVAASLAAERRAALVRDWVAGLRRRANITILPA